MVITSDARAYKNEFVAGNAAIFRLISMRATRRSSSETIRSSAREEYNHAGAPPHPAHVHALSADAPRRGLTRRDCGRLRLNQPNAPVCLSRSCRPELSNSSKRDRSMQRLDTVQNAVPKAYKCFRACDTGRTGVGDLVVGERAHNPGPP